METDGCVSAMHDSAVAWRTAVLRVSLRRRPVDICGIPDDSFTSNPKFRSGFASRAWAAGVPDKDIYNILRGVFGNLALMTVALAEGRIASGEYGIYRRIHEVCIQIQTGKKEGFGDIDGSVLEEWEKLLARLLRSITQGLEIHRVEGVGQSVTVDGFLTVSVVDTLLVTVGFVVTDSVVDSVIDENTVNVVIMGNDGTVADQFVRTPSLFHLTTGTVVGGIVGTDADRLDYLSCFSVDDVLEDVGNRVAVFGYPVRFSECQRGSCNRNYFDQGSACNGFCFGTRFDAGVRFGTLVRSGNYHCVCRSDIGVTVKPVIRVSERINFFARFGSGFDMDHNRGTGDYENQYCEKRKETES